MENAGQSERAAVINMQLNAYLSMQPFRTGDAQVTRGDMRMKSSDMKKWKRWTCSSPSAVGEVVKQQRDAQGPTRHHKACKFHRDKKFRTSQLIEHHNIIII